MSLLPVIVRELRAQARQPLTVWLRIIGGASVFGAIAAALWTMGTIEVQLGRARALPSSFQAFGTILFGKMNLFIFVAIWLVVPMATADAVSRERREGTLALLYLTELRSLGIVVGKVFVHLLRSVSLFLTMAPWLMLGLLFGGVGLRDIGMALMLDFASLLLAQAAGLLASTIPRDWLKSVILAELFAMSLLLGMLYVHGGILRNAVRVGVPTGLTPGTPAFWNSSFSIFAEFYGEGGGIIGRTSRLIEFTTNGSFHQNDDWYGTFGWPPGYGRATRWQQIWTRLLPAGQDSWFLGVAGMVVGAALVLVAAIWIGAWRVEKSWQDAPPQVLVSEMRRSLLLPRFGVGSLNRSLSRSLTANPIGWLQHYSPSARMVKWGWCLFVIIVELIFSTNSADLYGAQAGVGLVLLLGLTFSATGSFRKELETGAFELLLVTPLRERQIITGRVRGLWRQFLPALLLYGAGMIYLSSGWSNHYYVREAWHALARTLTGFCALPLIGLYFSMQRWNFFAAWLASCLIGLLPAGLGRAFGATDSLLIPLQIGVALAAAGFLERRLRNREFLQK
jgi:ABC-type transport system involved in multi-copper enzyme maturation permease subunit